MGRKKKKQRFGQSNTKKLKKKKKNLHECRAQCLGCGSHAGRQGCTLGIGRHLVKNNSAIYYKQQLCSYTS